MSKRLDLTGQRFGRLKVVNYAGTRRVGKQQTASFWRCVCDCGGSAIVMLGNLRGGKTKSCKCLRAETRRLANLRVVRTVHGDACERTDRTATEYYSWGSMIQRCGNPNNTSYKHYGGRGITICERWRNSYPAFLADMGRKPSPLHSLDRFPNNDGNYEPGNVRWATRSEQNKNKRRPTTRSEPWK